MANKPATLTDEEIFTKVSAKSQNSVSWFDSRLSRERERVTRYLNGELPKRSSEGSSSYVSSDVYDSVEMQRSQLLEVFAGGDHIAQFDPDQDMDVDRCMVATQYASYVIFRLNEGYNVFNNVIHDGLTSRAGVAKVYWEEKYKTSEETFQGLSFEDAHALAAQEDVSEFEGDVDPATGTVSGTLTRKKDVSKISIDPVAPEEFLIEPLATSVGAATYVGHRTPKTKAELMEMGYPRKKVMMIPSDDAKELQFSPEVLARTQQTHSNEAVDDPIQNELEYVVYYESYVRMQIDASKGVRLYKICHAGTTILDKQEVDKAPFIAYIPLPIPHVFYGNNFAARVIHTQNARTVLFRGVLDHTAITTNPRFMVVNGGLMNPRELLDNRLGGLVNVRRPDSVQPFQQQNLNPYVFNVLGLLTDNNDKSTGISALSQGLNKDAISTQNSKGLVDNMMKASGQRGKIMARNFAINFLVPLMLEIVRLAIIHKDKRVIEVAGKPLDIDADTWTERTTCTVSQHLGYGEKDTAAADLAQGYEMMAKDQGLGNQFGPKQRFEMLHDIAKLKGFNRFAAYLDPNAPPPQPDPLKVRELDIKDKTATAALQATQIKQQDANRLYALDQTKVQQKSAEIHLKALDQDRTNDRQDTETAARIQQGEEQIDVEREKIQASERTAARNAAAKASQPKAHHA
ncbi:portal protein [Bradyrhizobium sp. USDA 4350]